MTLVSLAPSSHGTLRRLLCSSSPSNAFYSSTLPRKRSLRIAEFIRSSDFTISWVYRMDQLTFRAKYRLSRDIDGSASFQRLRQGDLGIVAGFGDHGATVGVVDQDDRAVLHRDDSLRQRNIVLKRCEGILHRRYMQTLGLEQWSDAPERPTAVSEGARGRCRVCRAAPGVRNKQPR
jgi:hypothetical protein